MEGVPWRPACGRGLLGEGCHEGCSMEGGPVEGVPCCGSCEGCVGQDSQGSTLVCLQLSVGILFEPTTLSSSTYYLSSSLDSSCLQPNKDLISCPAEFLGSTPESDTQSQDLIIFVEWVNWQHAMLM